VANEASPGGPVGPGRPAAAAGKDRYCGGSTGGGQESCSKLRAPGGIARFWGGFAARGHALQVGLQPAQAIQGRSHSHRSVSSLIP